MTYDELEEQVQELTKDARDGGLSDQEIAEVLEAEARIHREGQS